MLLSGTSTQALAGVTDDPAALLDEWAALTGGDPSRPWVRRFAEDGASQVHDWLQDLGLDLSLTDARDPGASALRVHVPDGGGPALAEALLAAGDPADILLETEVVGLIFTESGRCVGVAVQDAAGAGWLRAGAVILATGGFSRDLDRVAWANPELPLDKLAFAGAPWTDGKGHGLLEAAGAAWQNPRAMGIYAHGVADPRAPGEELTVAHLDAAMWVNRDGRRFFGENHAGSFAAGPALLRQPEQQGWALVDDALWNRMGLVDAMPLEAEPVPHLPDLVDAGRVLEAEDPAALALALLMDHRAITGEIDAWNVAFDEDAPDRLRGSPPPAALSAGPWRALPLQAALSKSFGGIAVEVDGRVVDAAGAPLPGLFAAGELTGMAGGSLVGDRGFTGSLSAVLLSGRVAGDRAAAEALD